MACIWDRRTSCWQKYGRFGNSIPCPPSRRSSTTCRTLGRPDLQPRVFERNVQVVQQQADRLSDGPGIPVDELGRISLHRRGTRAQGRVSCACCSCRKSERGCSSRSRQPQTRRFSWARIREAHPITTNRLGGWYTIRRERSARQKLAKERLEMANESGSRYRRSPR